VLGSYQVATGHGYRAEGPDRDPAIDAAPSYAILTANQLSLPRMIHVDGLYRLLPQRSAPRVGTYARALPDAVAISADIATAERPTPFTHSKGDRADRADVLRGRGSEA
jgi:hypothetical protein